MTRLLARQSITPTQSCCKHSYRAFTSPDASTTLRLVSFGSIVRIKREALGLTLEQLAERAQLTPNYLGSIERDKRDPSLSTVLSIAKALRTPAADLVGGAHDLGAEGIEAGRLFEAAPSEIQDAVLRLLRVLGRRRR